VLIERESLVRSGVRAVMSSGGGGVPDHAVGALLVGSAGVGTSSVARAIAAEVAAAGAVVRVWAERDRDDPRLADAPFDVALIDALEVNPTPEDELFAWLGGDPRRRVVFAVGRGIALGPRTTDLWSSGRLIRLDVPPLTHLGVEAMASALLGGPVTRGLNDYLVRASGGRPLLVRELIEDGCQAGAIFQVGAVWAFQGPPTIGTHLRDLVGTRLSRWPDDEREALELIACSGGAPVRLLLRLVGADSLDACERRQLVIETVPGTLRVAPPAVEQAVVESMSSARRSTLRGRLATLVAELHDPPDPLVLRAASWALDDGVRPAPALAVAAARAATRTGDFVAAQRLATAAVGSEADAEARLVLGQALRFEGRHERARDVLTALLSPPVGGEPSPDVVEQATIALAQLTQYGFDRPDDAAAILDAALDRGGSLQLEANRLALIAFAGRHEDALADLERIATDPAASDLALAVVLPPLVLALAYTGRGREALAHGSRALKIAPGVADDLPYAMTNATATWFLAHVLGGWDLVDLPVVGELAITPLIQLGLGLPLLRAGDAAGAMAEIDKALAGFSVGDPAGYTPLAHAAGAAAAVLAGDVSRGIALMAEVRRTPLRVCRCVEPEIEHLLLWPELFRGGVESVGAICRRLVDEYDRRSIWAASLAVRHTAMRLGVGGLRPSDELLADVDTPVARAIEAQFRGLEHHDAALLLDASERFERCGMRVCAAEATAQAHQAARAADQRTLARSAALRVRDLTEGIDISPYPLLHDWSAPEPLTPREREVAILASQLLTNREIAGRLGSSPRTVEGHLHRAYSKLGVSDRHELRARLRRGDA